MAGMAEEACRVLGGDGVESGAEGVMQGPGGARGSPAQLGFQLGPGGLDEARIRRAGGRVAIEEAGAV